MKPLVNEFRKLIEDQSIQRGEFTLTSGATSKYYCDMKATTLSPRGAYLTGEVLFPLLAERGAEAVGGLAMGAIFVSMPVVYASAEHGHPIYGFTVREQQKAHGLKKAVEECRHPDGQPLLDAGRKVAVVDDVVTKGGSVLKAIEVVRSRGCEIVAVAAVVDRRAGGGEKLLAQGLPYFSLFRTDDEGNIHVSEELR